MRISDWSSDVCSSDLCRTIEDFPRAATESGYAREIIPKLKPRMALFELFNKGTLMRISKSLVLAASVLAPALAQAAEGDQIVVTAARAEKRSDERRVGRECVRTCRSRWWRSH